MDYTDDRRIVMTLDAGGTNFVFSAIRGNSEIVEPLQLPSMADDIDACLDNIVEGFSYTLNQIDARPDAISFAFPGPADYPRGIIGDLGNLPAFRGGIPLAPMLEGIFSIPVFINNDGNLFVLGESIAGLLPRVNSMLTEAGSSKKYKNLFGVTIGTGFGGGIVIDGKLLIGDNSSAGEIWLMRHKNQQNLNAEEGVSIRAVKRYYSQLSNINIQDSPEPERIYKIAKGEAEGNREAAREAFHQLGEIAGDALANSITLIDGLIVIGGGLSGAHELFLPRLVEEMNSVFDNGIKRLEVKAFNLEDEYDLEKFLKGEEKMVKVPRTEKSVVYDPIQRIGVGISKLGTEKAVHIGAYAFALSKLDGSG